MWQIGTAHSTHPTYCALTRAASAKSNPLWPSFTRQGTDETAAGGSPMQTVWRNEPNPAQLNAKQSRPIAGRSPSVQRSTNESVARRADLLAARVSGSLDSCLQLTQGDARCASAS